MPVNRLFVTPLIQIATLLAALVGVHLVNFIGSMWLTRFGVIPRTFRGLRGILFSPLLHANWAHLAANTVPLGVMLGLLAFSRGKALWPITGALWIGSGIIVWIIGRPGAVQVGASGVIYALAAFLVTSAWQHRDLKSALAALVVLFLYGGIAWGLLPVRQGVSWEGHLAGAIAGVIVALQWREGSF